MKLRRITSLTILLAFVAMALTGVVLYLVPEGRVAYWSGWTLWGLSKTQWGQVHLTMGLLMLVAGIVHVWLNWRPIVSYLRTRPRRARLLVSPEAAAALALTLAVAVLTLFEIPPMSWVLAGSEAFKARAATVYGEPPYGHAEQSPLGVFARRVGIDPMLARQTLEQAGWSVPDPGATLAEIAAAHGRTPRDLWRVLEPLAGREADGRRGGLPLEPPAGTGRRTVGEIAGLAGVPVETVLDVLADEGIEAAAGTPLREVAERHGRTAQQLYEAIRQRLSAASAEACAPPGSGTGTLDAALEGGPAAPHHGAGSSPGLCTFPAR
ncbi:MAG: DUF4405 domain-containing protein [Acidobacteria bacterium]|nr:MAG: DUF4405 domain-containing protein [Acidobacteriota bacterium]